MDSLVLDLPTKIIFGRNEFSKIKKYLAGFGSRALVVTGKSSAKKHGYLDNLLKQLTQRNIKSFVFDQIEPNPQVKTIDRAALFGSEHRCQFVIGLGGGSVLDAAKCIAVVMENGGTIWDYASRGTNAKFKKFNKAKPIVLIPTLAGTSSEADCFAVVTNTEYKEKVGVFGRPMFAKVSIVDPGLTLTVPQNHTLFGAIDTITHVLETFLSSKAHTSLQDLFTLSLVKTVMENLELVLKDLKNIEAREQLSWCSTIALSGFFYGRDGGWPLHAIEHTLSAYYDIPHGQGLAALLSAILEFDSPLIEKKLQLMGKFLFAKDKINSKSVIALFVAWLKKVGACVRLKDLNIDQRDFSKLAESTINVYGKVFNCLENIKPLYKKDIISILEKSY